MSSPNSWFFTSLERSLGPSTHTGGRIGSAPFFQHFFSRDVSEHLCRVLREPCCIDGATRGMAMPEGHCFNLLVFSLSLFFLIYLFNVYEYIVLMWLLGTEFRTHSGQLCSLWPKDLFIIIHKYTVADFRCSRRGRQISLWVVVSYHVVSGI
jgi:type IV secretory pathway TrbD component